MAMQTTGSNTAGEPMTDINTTPVIDVSNMISRDQTWGRR